MKDEELANEMLELIKKNETRGGYSVLMKDHFFFQQVVDFMQDKRIWLGTASDLVSDMNCKTVPVNTAAKLLHKYGKTMLKKKGFSVKFIRTNQKRLIELKK